MRWVSIDREMVSFDTATDGHRFFETARCETSDLCILSSDGSSSNIQHGSSSNRECDRYHQISTGVNRQHESVAINAEVGSTISASSAQLSSPYSCHPSSSTIYLSIDSISISRVAAAS
ncbi:hypothetical protein DY000_02006367 [Brassica cretica]|uniref:Uncharacterized protein n=1 Tax=Brassica cretica TaxID=69181 RepID=A0ABQ7BWJ3_BRACR|nr:hypothetical protein DY000_02006367 [Brassica cretica]